MGKQAVGELVGLVGLAVGGVRSGGKPVDRHYS